MKELGYTTKEIMESAGTMILTMQVWLFGVIIYSVIIPFVMFILKSFHKEDLASFEKELVQQSIENATKVTKEVKEMVIKKQKKELAEKIEAQKKDEEEEKKEEKKEGEEEEK